MSAPACHLDRLENIFKQGVNALKTHLEKQGVDVRKELNNSDTLDGVDVDSILDDLEENNG